MKTPLPTTPPPPNHESYQSSIANFHILSHRIPRLLRCLHPGFLWSLAKGTGGLFVGGKSDSGCIIDIGLRGRALVSPPSLAENSARWPGFERRVGNVARDRRGASAFQPFPRRKFSRAMSSEIDSRPQLPDKSDINVETRGASFNRLVSRFLRFP